MKSTIVGLAVLLVCLLLFVMVVPPVHSVQNSMQNSVQNNVEGGRLELKPVVESTSNDTLEMPVSITETPLAITYANEDDVLFQRVIAELVKTFYIA